MYKVQKEDYDSYKTTALNLLFRGPDKHIVSISILVVLVGLESENFLIINWYRMRAF
jgi:hypothetical protein